MCASGATHAGLWGRLKYSRAVQLWPQQACFPDPGIRFPVFAGLCNGGLEADDERMEKPAASLKKTRPTSDLFGAFCFVVLVLTVLYATLTID